MPSDAGSRDATLFQDLGGRFEPGTLLAVVWAAVAVAGTRRALRRKGVDARVWPPPPPLPWRAGRGVRFVVNRLPATCLERALVMQRWLTAHDQRYDVVIGVALGDSGFRAHAWLDISTGAADPALVAANPYQELMRLRPT